MSLSRRAGLRRPAALAIATTAITVIALSPPAQVAAAPAAAQQWPTKPVRLVVPFPPGGSVDPLARLLGSKLSELLGQQFIVENKPGASGSMGTAFAAK